MQEFFIVGTEHYGDVVKRLRAGNYPVTVVREPKNEFDVNAIAVKYNRQTIGYVSAYFAARIFPHLDSAGGRYKTEMVVSDGKGSVLLPAEWDPPLFTFTLSGQDQYQDTLRTLELSEEFRQRVADLVPTEGYTYVYYRSQLLGYVSHNRRSEEELDRLLHTKKARFGVYPSKFKEELFVGISVDLPWGNEPEEIYITRGSSAAASNDTEYAIHFFIWLFLGIFGGHRFYKKQWKMGFIYLFTAGLFLIGWIVDGIKLAIYETRRRKQING